MTAELSHYPIYVEQNVHWGEMDAFQHVNNTVYFKYFENVRIKFMEEAGIMAAMEQLKMGPILAKIDANYKIPLTYPDTIKTYLSVKSIGNSSFVVEHLVWSEKYQKIACSGEGVVVMLDYGKNTTVPMNDEIKTILKRYMVNS
jgi:acyl-CoA thioester hydrolase